MADVAFYDSDFEDGRLDLDPGAEDSDEESLMNGQSPSDRHLEHPFDDQKSTAQSRKDRAAAEERERAANAAALRSPARSEEESARISDAGPPPPDYESAIAGQELQRQTFDVNHPLVRNGLFDARASTPSGNRQPQSMTDSSRVQYASITGQSRSVPVDNTAMDDALDESAGLLGQQRGNRRKKAGRHCGRACLKKCMVILGVLIIIFIAVFATRSKSDRDFPNAGDSWRGPQHGLPVQDQPKGPTPSHPATSGQCTLTSFSDTESFDINTSGQSFEFVERIDSSSYDNIFPSGVPLSGSIRISPADDVQEEDVKVFINIATNDAISVQKLESFTDQGFFQLFFPDIKYHGIRGVDPACIDFAIAIHVRNGTQLSDWATSTAHFDIAVDKGLFDSDSGTVLSISNETSLTAAGGDINIAYWSSRKTRVDTTSGSIEGTYALRDLLSMTSSSGSVKALVEPKEADSEKPVPAELIASTNSGSINVEVLTDHAIPDRDYQTKVSTQSSSIAGRYLLGSSTSFSSHSGSIKVDVLPYSADVAGTILRTENTSGSTKLKLLPPYTSDARDVAVFKHREGVIDALTSRHKSMSGAVWLQYPQEWEGMFDGRSLSGSIALEGRDVIVPANLDLPGSKRVTGRKGYGKSELNVHTVSGSIYALIGEE